MNTLMRELLKQNDTVLKAEKIYSIFPDLNENAVRAKIKRCLKSGDLVRLYKGVYTTNPEFRKRPVLDETVAQAIDERAFLSGIGALRFHDLIPEAVKFKTFFGLKEANVDADPVHFRIKRLRENLMDFGVEEVKVSAGVLRISDPVRAIMDVLLAQHFTPTNQAQICAFLRIEEDEVDQISWKKAFRYAEHFGTKAAEDLAKAMNITGSL
jgi:predicted transcriptional regulator of viral defense system